MVMDNIDIKSHFVDSQKYERLIVGENMILIPKNTMKDIQSAIFFNKLSNTIWEELIINNKTVTEIHETLFELYDVDKIDLLSDIVDIINRLIKLDCIEYSN